MVPTPNSSARRRIDSASSPSRSTRSRAVAAMSSVVSVRVGIKPARLRVLFRTVYGTTYGDGRYGYARQATDGGGRRRGAADGDGDGVGAGQLRGLRAR